MVCPGAGHLTGSVEGPASLALAQTAGQLFLPLLLVPFAVELLLGYCVKARAHVCTQELTAPHAHMSLCRHVHACAHRSTCRHCTRVHSSHRHMHTCVHGSQAPTCTRTDMHDAYLHTSTRTLVELQLSTPCRACTLDRPGSPCAGGMCAHSPAHPGVLGHRSGWALGRTLSAPWAFPGRQDVSCSDT